MFIEDLIELSKEITYYESNVSSTAEEAKLNQIIQDTIKIFYDYCIDTDNDLHIALKYMIENHKRPRFYYDNSFYWYKMNYSSNLLIYHHLEPKLFCKLSKTYIMIDTYENLIRNLKEAL